MFKGIVSFGKMASLIVAMTKNGGIGLKGKLPWRNPYELKLFKEYTRGMTLIAGRVTASKLPYLTDRKIVCVSSDTKCLRVAWKNRPVNTIASLLEIEDIPEWKNNVMIIGGGQIYKSALQTKIGSIHLVQKVYMSIMEDEYECDTFFDNKWLEDFVVTYEQKYNGIYSLYIGAH